MASSFPRTHATADLLDDDPDILRLATCPLCHTPATLSQSAVEAGGEWRCGRCGQRWDAVRLATVAAYEAWVVDHNRRLGRRGTEGSHEAALVGSLPTRTAGRQTVTLAAGRLEDAALSRAALTTTVDEAPARTVHGRSGVPRALSATCLGRWPSYSASRS